MIKLLYSSSFSLGHLPTVMVSLLLMLVEKVNACSVTEHNASCYDDDDDDSLLYGAMFTSYQMACAFPFLFFFFSSSHTQYALHLFYVEYFKFVNNCNFIMYTFTYVYMHVCPYIHSLIYILISVYINVCVAFCLLSVQYFPAFGKKFL